MNKEDDESRHTSNEDSLSEKLATIKPVVPSTQAAAGSLDVDTPTNIAYENRVVAFVDILGFKEVIQRSKNDPELVSRIFYALDVRKDSWAEAYSKEVEFTYGPEFFDDRFHSFSDCIVMSVSSRIEDVGLLIYSVFKICRQLLNQGFVSRGGIAMGDLYHHDDSGEDKKSRRAPSMVFGPAFIDAYQFESSHADGPRVILQNSVWKTICAYRREHPDTKLSKFLKVHVPRAEDGPAFIDIFADFGSNEFYASHRDLDNEIGVLKAHICHALDGATDRPHVFKKNAQLAREFNKAIREAERFQHLIPSDKLPNRPF